jgi:hypothetical protein
MFGRQMLMATQAAAGLEADHQAQHPLGPSEGNGCPGKRCSGQEHMPPP